MIRLRKINNLEDLNSALMVYKELTMKPEGGMVLFQELNLRRTKLAYAYFDLRLRRAKVNEKNRINELTNAIKYFKAVDKAWLVTQTNDIKFFYYRYGADIYIEYAKLTFADCTIDKRLDFGLKALEDSEKAKALRQKVNFEKNRDFIIGAVDSLREYIRHWVAKVYVESAGDIRLQYKKRKGVSSLKEAALCSVMAYDCESNHKEYKKNKLVNYVLWQMDEGKLALNGEPLGIEGLYDAEDYYTQAIEHFDDKETGKYLDYHLNLLEDALHMRAVVYGKLTIWFREEEESEKYRDWLREDLKRCEDKVLANRKLGMSYCAGTDKMYDNGDVKKALAYLLAGLGLLIRAYKDLYRKEFKAWLKARGIIGENYCTENYSSLALLRNAIIKWGDVKKTAHETLRGGHAQRIRIVQKNIHDILTNDKNQLFAKAFQRSLHVVTKRTFDRVEFERELKALETGIELYMMHKSKIVSVQESLADVEGEDFYARLHGLFLKSVVEKTSSKDEFEQGLKEVEGKIRLYRAGKCAATFVPRKGLEKLTKETKKAPTRSLEDQCFDLFCKIGNYKPGASEEAPLVEANKLFENKKLEETLKLLEAVLKAILKAEEEKLQKNVSPKPKPKPKPKQPQALSGQQRVVARQKPKPKQKQKPKQPKASPPTQLSQHPIESPKKPDPKAQVNQAPAYFSFGLFGVKGVAGDIFASWRETLGI